MQNSSKVETYLPTRIPKIKCSLHSGQHYTHLCLDSKCIKKCLCRQCLKEHSEEHSIISVKEAVLTEAQKIHKNLEERHDHLKILHHTTTLKIKSMQHEINEMFESLKSRINDIFQNIHESSSHYLSWANAYLEKISQIEKNPSQDKLRSLVDMYKIIDELGETYNFVPQSTFEDFLTKMNTWAASIKLITKVLEGAYVQKKYRFESMVVEKEYGNNGLKCSSSRATTICGNLGIFSFDSTEGRRAPLLICYPKQEAIVGSYHHSVDTHPIQSIAWVDKCKMFVTSSLVNLRCFTMNALSRIKCVSNVRRPQGANVVYIPHYDFIVTSGKSPHCKVMKLNHGKLRTVLGINHALKNDERCTDIAYNDAEEHIILAFPLFVCVYDLRKKTFIQEINLSCECLIMKYFPSRKCLVLGLSNYRLEVYKYTGVSTLTLDRKIETKGNKPCCIVSNEDETQLLIASNESFLEYCELEDKKTQELNLKFKMKMNSMIYFKENKKVIGAGDGNFVFVLGMK